MERIFTVLNHGRAEYEVHIAPEDTMELDVENLTLHIRAAGVVSERETFFVDETDGSRGPNVIVREITTDGEEVQELVQTWNDLTVEELKGILRDKELPVSGTKAELIARLDEES